VDTDRRGFLRWAAGAAALWLGARGARAAPLEDALAIHRATRNTPTGAVGAAFAQAFRDPLPPFKPYPDRPRLALPQPTWQRGRPLAEVVERYAPARAFAPEPCSREELARVLFLGNGVTQRTGPISRRAAPSAGALYAGELYVLAERVTDVPTGVYSYAVDSHELVRVGDGSHLAESGAAFAIAITNVFARYAVRYANRGYRYALIDTGHIGENVRLAASELGLHDEAPLRFEDDRWNALLGVDGRDEAVCALHLVGRAAAGARTAATRRALVERQHQERGGAWRELPMPQRYHEATKLVPARDAGAERPEAAAPAPPPRAGAEAPGVAVHEAIRLRRSAQRFARDPMRRADVLQVLALARANGALHRSAELDLLVSVHRVGDTPPGLYRYQPATRALALVRPGDLSGPLVRACLGQQRVGEAAAAVIAVARVAEASARGGARSYRDLLLDAGATAQRVYLAAEALGLAARNLAAYLDDSLDALLGLDGRTAVAVHLTAVGPGD
jgi:SagB-type dehydrogenase family enzyme